MARDVTCPLIISGIPPRFVMSNCTVETLDSPCFFCKSSSLSWRRPRAMILVTPSESIFSVRARPMPEVAPMTRT